MNGMMTVNCANCGEVETWGSVTRDGFTYCADCISPSSKGYESMSMQRKREAQRTKYAKDLIQPWKLKNDKPVPNEAFIKQYPDKTKKFFKSQDLKKAC